SPSGIRLGNQHLIELVLRQHLRSERGIKPSIALHLNEEVPSRVVVDSTLAELRLERIDLPLDLPLLQLQHVDLLGNRCIVAAHRSTSFSACWASAHLIPAMNACRARWFRSTQSS